MLMFSPAHCPGPPLFPPPPGGLLVIQLLKTAQTAAAISIFVYKYNIQAAHTRGKGRG